MCAKLLRNVEIKARLTGKEQWQQLIELASNLTKSKGEIILQRDIFFHSKQGRLKLRYLLHKKSELIYYDRPDVGGPKLSSFHKVDLEDPETMEQMLDKSIGTKGKVQKERYLFLHEGTRIHLDNVDGLGYFLEFEAVLKPDESVESGEKRLHDLLQVFNIPKENLMEGAYMDELMKND
ncbi:uncharacterized protein LOC134833552 [Culicoides brevitarsis]|uniref:uncharacterized protein LOC134833552 n=1 Tax=Culicoides brevitarsis TaxID=469753 RepID=UPI00307BC7D2